MKRDLHFEILYPHPINRVWLALTDPVAVGEWLMPNNFEPRVGHRFRFRTSPAPGFDGIINSEVLEVDPPRRLVYTWTNGTMNTRVTWTLKDTPEGTLLTLDHTGFEGVRGWMLSGMLGQGWRSKKLAKNLAAYLAKLSIQQPGETQHEDKTKV
jgi:uncharacterized protein YndB with AHSA1/START domain